MLPRCPLMVGAILLASVWHSSTSISKKRVARQAECRLPRNKCEDELCAGFLPAATTRNQQSTQADQAHARRFGDGDVAGEHQVIDVGDATAACNAGGHDAESLNRIWIPV